MHESKTELVKHDKTVWGRIGCSFMGFSSIGVSYIRKSRLAAVHCRNVLHLVTVLRSHKLRPGTIIPVALSLLPYCAADVFHKYPSESRARARRIPFSEGYTVYSDLSDPEMNNGRRTVYSGRIGYVPVSTAKYDFAGIILSDKRKAYQPESIARATRAI